MSERKVNQNEDFDNFFTAIRDHKKSTTITSIAGQDAENAAKFQYNQEIMDHIYQANPEAFYDDADYGDNTNPYAGGYYADQGAAYD